MRVSEIRVKRIRVNQGLHSDWRENLVKDFFVKIDFPPMRAFNSFKK